MSQIRFARFHLLLGVSLVPMLRSPTAHYLVTGALKEAASRPVEDTRLPQGSQPDREGRDGGYDSPKVCQLLVRLRFASF